MIINLPLPEKVSTNAVYAGMHWTKRKELADLYHYSLLPFKKKKVTEYPVEISYRFTFKGKLLDTSNVSFMAKLLEDGMVANMILKNDDPMCVCATHLYVKKGREDKVEIVINTPQLHNT